MAEIKEAFVLFDTEHSGHLDCRELKAAMNALGLKVRKDELRKVMVDMGKDIFSTVDFIEFVSILEPRLPDKNSVDEVAKIFALFDDD
jgi:Ca2+-binding EF-hand superfamily protein